MVRRSKEHGGNLTNSVIFQIIKNRRKAQIENRLKKPQICGYFSVDAENCRNRILWFLHVFVCFAESVDKYPQTLQNIQSLQSLASLFCKSCKSCKSVCKSVLQSLWINIHRLCKTYKNMQKPQILWMFLQNLRTLFSQNMWKGRNRNSVVCAQNSIERHFDRGLKNRAECRSIRGNTAFTFFRFSTLFFTSFLWFSKILSILIFEIFSISEDFFVSKHLCIKETDQKTKKNTMSKIKLFSIFYFSTSMFKCVFSFSSIFSSFFPSIFTPFLPPPLSSHFLPYSFSSLQPSQQTWVPFH